MAYRLLHGFWVLCSYLPLWAMYGFVELLLPLLYHVVRYRRKVVRRNLTESFPEKSLGEIRRIERKFYRYFLDTAVESCKMASMSPARMARRMRFPNVEAINSTLRQGHSIALFLGHLGNWEWVPSLALQVPEGVVGGQIYRSLKNKNMDRLLLENRQRFGSRCIEMRQTARAITDLERRGQTCCIGFIADQSPKWREIQHRVPFLHHDTPVMLGTEKLALHWDMEPWFVDVRRIRRGHWEATFHPMKAEDRPGALTELYYRMLEGVLRERPAHYLWTHNRFKYAKKLGD